jgi:pyruvate,water dikinase
VAEKPVRLVCAPGGTLVEEPVPQDQQGRPCLTEAQVRTLAGYALRLEEHYGVAQDIEWALPPGGELLVLQSRPLGLVPGAQGVPAGMPRWRAGRFWLRAARWFSPAWAWPGLPGHQQTT